MGCEEEVIIRDCQNLQERAVKLTSNPARCSRLWPFRIRAFDRS